MNKVKKRTIIILALAALLVAGLILFLAKLGRDGADWAAFPSNDHVYDHGVFTAGQVMDRNGNLLLTTDGEGLRDYTGDSEQRRADLYAVGDAEGNIGGSCLDLFKDKLMGYSIVNGVYSYNGDGRNVWLTTDSDVNLAAYQALDGRDGCVGVMNYESGELVCMVGTPAFDPADPPEDASYLNKFLSGTFVPGSVFKLVTAWAAIEELDTDSYTYYCDGWAEYDGEGITCPYAHGELSFADALAVSCNGAFADIAQKLGGDTLAKYAAKAGLTESHEVSGFTTAAGNFDTAAAGSWELGWSGSGQYNDLVNPYAMLRYVSAIANEGKAAEGELLHRVTTAGGIPYWFNLGARHKRIMSRESAAVLKELMANNVQSSYGVENFPDLPVCAKSGTAEVGDGAPHAWFVGFLNSDKYPYAFVVLVENGGSGASVAGSVANTVLQRLCFGK